MIKNAIITGASRGIGAAIAYRLHRDGYSVCINYNKSRDAALALCERIKSEGGRAIAVCADVSDRMAVREMVSRARAEFGDVGLLVCNAGIAHYSQFQDLTDEAWQRIFAVNVNGVFHTVQETMGDFLRNHEGCIVSISSIWGENGASCEAAYSATKHAIIGITKSLAAELAPTNIRVNCVAPGIIETDMLSALDRDFIETLCDETPLRRLGTPQDIAAIVSFLASESASFITGQVLTADGGFKL